MIIVIYILFPKYVTGRKAEAIDINTQYTTIPFDNESKYANFFCNDQKLDPCCISFTGSIFLHCCAILSYDFPNNYEFNYKLELGYTGGEPSLIHEWKVIVNKDLIPESFLQAEEINYIQDKNTKIVYIQK